MGKKKFLQYQLELVGTKEEDLTVAFVEKLNNDFDNSEGIYANSFGRNARICVNSQTQNTVLIGKIVADTQGLCNELYKSFKATAKETFPNCKKTLDLLVAKGDILF